MHLQGDTMLLQDYLRRYSRTREIRPSKLRKTGCTQLEAVAPGQGTAFLGHSCRTTTEQFYIDRSQLTRPPLPPL